MAIKIKNLLYRGHVVARQATGEANPPPAIIEMRDVWHRPPLGPPLAGSRATLGHRGHVKSQSREAKARRRDLCLRALALRAQGLSIQAIAAQIGVSTALAGRWLVGVYPPTVLERPHPRRGGGLPRNRAPRFLDGPERYVVVYPPDGGEPYGVLIPSEDALDRPEDGVSVSE